MSAGLARTGKTDREESIDVQSENPCCLVARASEVVHFLKVQESGMPAPSVLVLCTEERSMHAEPA